MENFVYANSIRYEIRSSAASILSGTSFLDVYFIFKNLYLCDGYLNGSEMYSFFRNW
ncbi:hypothetical protein JHK84_039956 [Glycine max]|nr:hypothetical protein JHK84_039956 [Glycine max]